MKKNTLSVELWLTIVKYALAKDVLYFGNNLIANMLKMQIFGAIKKNCGDEGVCACQKIIDIHVNLTHSQQHQRYVQCSRIQQAGLLPKTLIADLQTTDWPTLDILNRAANSFGILQFSPGANINIDIQVGEDLEAAFTKLRQDHENEMRRLKEELEAEQRQNEIIRAKEAAKIAYLQFLVSLTSRWKDGVAISSEFFQEKNK